VAVEPDPRSFGLLLENTRVLHDVTCVNAAVGDYNGTGALNRFRERSWASSLAASSKPSDSVRVPVRTLETVVDEAQIETIGLLKLDVEGAEWDILRTTTALPHIDWIAGEIHLAVTRDQTLDDLLANLAGFKVEILERDELRAVFIARRAL